MPTRGRTNGRHTLSHSVQRHTHNTRRNNPNNRPPPERLEFNGPDGGEQNGVTTQTDIGAPTAGLRALPSQTSRFCDVFTGSNPLVPVEDWLGLFDIVTDRFAPEDKLAALGRHVSGEAMQWLVREIGPQRHQLTWDQVRQHMIGRFGRSTDNNLNEAMDRVLRLGERIEAYFYEKRRLLTLAGEPARNQVTMLTRGIQNRLLRMQITTAQPQSPDEWLRIATALENSLNLSDDRTNNHSNRGRAQVNFTDTSSSRGRKGAQQRDRRSATTPDFSRPPSTPCPICRLLGHQEFHWKKNCTRVRQSDDRTDATTTNTANAPPQNASTGANVVQTRPEPVHMKIFINGQPIIGLLDTGASVTCLSKRAAERIGLTWDHQLGKTIDHADGDSRTLGGVIAAVTIQGRSHEVQIQILDRLRLDCLIGIDLQWLAEISLKFSRPLGLLAQPQLSDRITIPSHHFAMTIITDVQPIRSTQTVATMLTTPALPQPKINPKLKGSDLDALQTVLHSMNKVFARDDNHIGKIVKFEHTIRLKEGAQPVSQTPFRFSPVREAQLRKHIDRMLAAGVIRKSTSPWCCRMFLVKKDIDDTRPVVDFRRSDCP